ncbi:GIP [Symbiodinium sp. CCMP2592]|nr:GIP [Symbiodinium sp. CCMP2592]
MAYQDDGTNTADHDDALAQAMDEEFEEARDGNTSVSPEDERSQRLFPDSEPLDPPYGLRATGASLEFGLDAAALGLLDGGSGSSTEQTATRHFSPQSDHELIPATEEPRSVAAGRMPQVTAPPPAVTNDLMGQLSAMLQQTLQSHVAPALDRMMMSQAAVMSRLDRLESERDSQVPLTAQGEHVLAMLQSLEVGSKPSASGANADAALKQPTTVPAGVLPESAVGVQDTRLHHARDLASKGNGSAHVEAPTHQNKGVTVVEGGEASGIRGFGLDPSPGIGEKPEEPTKTSLELPKLDKYNPSTSAIVAGDWLISLTPVITSLSASAWVFWEDCVSTAKLFYGRWLSSSPLERLHIQAEVLVNRYRDGKFSRVDQRAVSLLLAAVGNELKDDLISLRLLGTCAIVFKVMAKYQPGGAAEKQQLLSFLVTPENVTTSAASVKALRKWRRWLARARELQVIVPDPSLQLKGLERLAPTLSAPTQQTVLQFSELLLAEAEEAVLSEAADKGGARQTVAKADEVPGKGGKVGKEGKGASKGAAKVDGGKQLCRLWRTDDGCRYGKSCTFAHDALTPADKRCFNCSSTKHRKPDCPFPRAQAEPGGKPGKGSQKGKSGDEVMKAQDKGASETDKSARDELIARANAVLESIQTSIKALQLGSKYPPKPGPRDETGLIDSGATTCMRMRREDEQPVGEKTVSLAQGEVQMGFSAGGVLLANEEVEPIVSLRQLITIGFRLVWSKRACQLFDEEGYSVPLSTASGCPRVCKAVAQNLIDRIETFNLHGYGEDQLAMMRDADAVSWEAVMCKVAESVREGRHEFDAVAAKHGAKVVAIDSTEDLNDPATYTYLLKQALAGKDEGPPVVRARYGVERFGLENLSHQEREKVDYDDQLMLRSFILGVASKWGPFKRGTHEGAKASYFLAAVFSVPRAPELNGSRVDKPEADVAAVPGEPGEWENADDDDRDDDDGGGVGPIELDDAPVEPEPQPLEQLELVHLPFVVPLPSKGARDVMNGIKGGDRFKANPFAENLIGILKGFSKDPMKQLQSVMMFALRGLTNQLKAGDIVDVPAMYARYGDEGSSLLRVKVVGEMRVVVMLSVEMRVVVMLSVVMRVVVRVVVILRVLMAVVVTLRVIVMTPESLVEGPVVSSGTSGFSGSAGWEDVSCDPLGMGARVGHKGGLNALNADFSEDCEFVDVSVTSNLLFCEPTCVEWESIVGRASDREVGPDDHDSSGETWVGVGEASESFDPDGQQIALKALLSRECKLQDRSGVAGDSDREGYIHGLSSTIKRLEERCCKADDGVEYSTLPDAEVLTTHTVPLEEVERHYSLWSAAVQAELDSLVHEKQAVRVITSAEMQAMQEKGTCVTIIPSKMVFTRKAGGRHKARLVACGNHLDGQGQAKGKQSPSKANLYAGGIDPSVMRQAASIAVKRAWKGGATDITTAFLNAELLDRVNPRSSPPPLSLDVPTEVIVLKIPSIVHRHGHVDRSCFMLVCKALYGLDQSPRDWSIKRDSEIEGMSCQVDGVTCMFEQSLVDSNLWYLRRVPKDGESHSWREPVACMLVYVDDLLAFGPSPVLTMIFELITSRWKCGPVEWIPEDPTKPPLKFFGFELRWDGKDLLLGQQDFIRDVATRYPEATASCVPATPGPLDVEDASERRPEDVSACQTALGEILWVAGRTRPDIIFAVSRLAQTMSRDPATVRKRVMQLIGYLVYTQDLCLRYRATYSCQGEPGATATPNAEGVIEAMTDSAFAPVCERSQESTLVYTQGSLTGWNTGRQPFTAASTAESELLSLMTGFSFGRAQTYVLQEFMGKVPRLVVLNDNMASISIVNGDSNGWRSRHLRIRAHVLREQAKQGHVVVGHIEGAKNIADAGTKALPYPRLKLLRDGMGLDAVRNVHDARPKGATKVIDPASAAKIQAVVLTLAAVTAEAQQSPDEPEGHSHELWFLMFLVCCTSIALWEGLKWACRWCCRRRRVQRREVERHEPEEEHSSDGENQPDDEDELQEFSPQAADRVEDNDVARELTVPLEGTVVRYVDDVMYVGPPPEEEEERLRRRRQGQRVYHDEPDFEPAAVEASGLPPWNVQNRVRQALEAQRDARGSNEGPNWMPNQFVNYPVIRLRADWPASENQPPLAYLAAYQSAWGGLASALHQLRPNDAYTRDEYTRHDARQNVLIRWHFGWRVMLFDPNRTTSPVAMSRLTGRRRTVITYSDGTEELLDDNFRIDSARRMMDQQWVRRTELEIREGT